MSSERRYSEPWSNTLSVENGTEGGGDTSEGAELTAGEGGEPMPMVGTGQWADSQRQTRRGGMRLPFAPICVRIPES
jgi:hypothetical protein